MYKVNLLPRKVLITPDEVIAWGPTVNSTDSRNIMQAIQIAEDRFIKPAICKDLYNDFRAQKNVIVTEINKDYLEGLFPTGTILQIGSFVNAIEFCTLWYQTFWNEQLWKLIAECVIYVATPTNWSRYSAAGEMVNNPKSISADNGSGASSIDLPEVKWKMDKLLMDRIDPLIASVQEWLYDNRGHLPFYNCREISSDCGQKDRYGNTTGVSYQRKTPWVHVYGKKRNDCDWDKY